MPCAIPPSFLSKFVSKLVGELEGRIMSAVSELVAQIQEKLQGQCPDLSELKSIIAKRDNLLNAINKVEQKIQPVGEFADKLDKPIKSAKVIVNLLEFLPLLTTFGTPPGPSGGVILSLKTGKVIRFGSLLRLACKLVEDLDREKEAIKSIVEGGLGNLEPIRSKLMSIDLKLFECVDALPDNQKEEIMESIEFLPSNTGLLDEQEDGTFSYTNPSSGNEYTIKVLEDPNSPEFAKKRYAAVFDAQGVRVMLGPSSFSSSTRILVDEIKFRINNQLP